MSARSPGSVMLRAATAASGGTGAPFATYCSIWPWTVRISAWTSTSAGVSSDISSTTPRRYGSVSEKRWRRSRDWPWTIARTVPSWSWTTWAIFASVPTSYSSDGSPMSSCSGWRWVTSAIGPPSATAAFSALTLFSRPTWRGTIISGKMTVSRSATSGSSRVSTDGVGCSSTGVDGRLAIEVLLGVRWRRGLGGVGLFGRPVGACGITDFKDASAEALFEFEQDLDPGEVHATISGQVTDPGEPPDVVLAVETDLGWGPCRAQEAFVFVDAKGSRVCADQGGRDADDVDGPLRVMFWTDLGHTAC